MFSSANFDHRLKLENRETGVWQAAERGEQEAEA